MTSTLSTSWQAANQRDLIHAIERVRRYLQQYVSTQGRSVASTTSDSTTNDSFEHHDEPSAMQTLCTAFSLTAFEQDLLILCAGVELSASFAQLCSKAQGNPQLSYPTFSLALATLPDAHWSALTPARPLRRWRLMEVMSGESLTQSRIRIDERVLHYLNGVSYLDDRLRGWMEPITIASHLPPSHQALVDRIIELWSLVEAAQEQAVIQLCGNESEGKVAIAAAACARLGIQLHGLHGADLPLAVAERDALARLWERESIFSQSALLIDCESLDRGNSEGLHNDQRLRAVLSFIEMTQGTVLVLGREPLPIRNAIAFRLDVNKPSPTEQRDLWQMTLQPLAPNLNGQLDTLVSQFNLGAASIQSIGSTFRIQQTSPDQDLAHSLWESCRIHARTRLDDLAQQIPPLATWDDLILPEVQIQTLREIAAQVRQRATVYEAWKFAVRGANGLGISALFTGTSGTGKTMAAEVLAQELQLDLYRIDLSQVVSKYIGETEKNLRRVFEAAETGGAILLFDEADALFGKRSEVKDSHDRYANIEVSYLLQRMEAYRGLAILTTNLRGAIDAAFLRRIRFVVQFPFPDVDQRLEIWRRIIPPKLPNTGLDLEKLAQLNIAGGNIRNIVLNGAFLAADAKEVLQMKHLLRAAQSEYAKLEKTLTEAETGGWT
jgi:hypothetical protein